MLNSTPWGSEKIKVTKTNFHFLGKITFPHF